jgi:hypothetical protein
VAGARAGLYPASRQEPVVLQDAIEALLPAQAINRLNRCEGAGNATPCVHDGALGRVGFGAAVFSLPNMTRDIHYLAVHGLLIESFPERSAVLRLTDTRRITFRMEGMTC